MKKDGITNAWTKALEDYSSKEAHYVDETTETDNKGLELDLERTQTKVCQAQGFVTCSEVQDMFAAEFEKSTPHCNAPEMAVVRQYKTIHSLLVVYAATKEGEKTACLIC